MRRYGMIYFDGQSCHFLIILTVFDSNKSITRKIIKPVEFLSFSSSFSVSSSSISSCSISSCSISSYFVSSSLHAWNWANARFIFDRFFSDARTFWVANFFYTHQANVVAVVSFFLLCFYDFHSFFFTHFNIFSRRKKKQAAELRWYKKQPQHYIHVCMRRVRW
jgi:hypothetical protein